MRKIVFCTDIHLNFNKVENGLFFDSIIAAKADGVFISGDIAESQNVATYLMDMSDKINTPIYFVLGNHDFYNGSIQQVRKEVANLSHSSDKIKYLPEAGVQEIAKDVCVVGVDGWYDGYHGKVLNPPRISMNDWNIIQELKGKDWTINFLLESLREIAKNEVDLAKMLLTKATEKYGTIYFLTHVPPWREAAIHLNKPSNDDWAPWFTSKLMGDMLEDFVEEYPLTNIHVLCGHTHGKGELQVAHNLRCRTGGAEYGKPQIETMIYIK